MNTLNYETKRFEGKPLLARYYAEFFIGEGKTREVARTPKTFYLSTVRASAINLVKAGFNVTIWEQAEDGTRKQKDAYEVQAVTIDEVKTFVVENYPRVVLEQLTERAEEGELENCFRNPGHKTPLNANLRAGAEQGTLQAARREFGHRGFCGRGEVAMLDELSRTFDSIDLSDTIAQAWRINKSAQEGEN